MKSHSDTGSSSGGARHHDALNIVISGGGGYVGQRLAKYILADPKFHGHVYSFDLRFPPLDFCFQSPRVHMSTGDISSASDVNKFFATVPRNSVVIHVASYGMSGREQLQHDRILQVNVGGTRNVVDACVKYGIRGIVYISTQNVVFVGKSIDNGDESIPYPDPSEFGDAYSRTKMLAEKLVLESNGLKLTAHRESHENGHESVGETDHHLRTCALRSAGIYGDGEQRHIPRIIDTMKKGLFCFTIGSPKNVCEWIYVDNLCHVSYLAAQRLIAADAVTAAPCGKPYFVSDEIPINNFEFFRPLIVGLGYPYPSVQIPLGLMVALAIITEFLYALLKPFYEIEPFLTCTEVHKVGVSHYFSTRAANRDLGYHPVVPFSEGMRRTVQWYVDNGYSRTEARPFSFSRFIAFIIGSIVIAAAIAFM